MRTSFDFSRYTFLFFSKGMSCIFFLTIETKNLIKKKIIFYKVLTHEKKKIRNIEQKLQITSLPNNSNSLPRQQNGPTSTTSSSSKKGETGSGYGKDIKGEFEFFFCFPTYFDFCLFLQQIFLFQCGDLFAIQFTW